MREPSLSRRTTHPTNMVCLECVAVGAGPDLLFYLSHPSRNSTLSQPEKRAMRVSSASNLVRRGWVSFRPFSIQRARIFRVEASRWDFMSMRAMMFAPSSTGKT